MNLEVATRLPVVLILDRVSKAMNLEVAARLPVVLILDRVSKTMNLEVATRMPVALVLDRVRFSPTCVHAIKQSKNILLISCCYLIFFASGTRARKL